MIETWRDRLYLDDTWVERSRENGRKWGAIGNAKRRDRQPGACQGRGAMLDGKSESPVGRRRAGLS